MDTLELLMGDPYGDLKLPLGPSLLLGSNLAVRTNLALSSSALGPSLPLRSAPPHGIGLLRGVVFSKHIPMESSTTHAQIACVDAVNKIAIKCYLFTWKPLSYIIRAIFTH